jgi:hypothetical protein
MSDEYIIKLGKSSDADAVILQLKSSIQYLPNFEQKKNDGTMYAKTDYVALLENDVRNNFKYSLVVIKNDPNTLYLNIMSNTFTMYEVLNKALPKNDFTVTEIDDDETITLLKAFRIPHIKNL